MKKTRIISLFLVTVMCLGLLASCSGGRGGGNDGGDRVGDGWEGVNFEGQEVIFCVSRHQTPECLFPAADRYTKGPDDAAGDKILQAVLKRNRAAEDTLNIEVTYETRNLYYDEAINDVRDIVSTASKNSPDLYNNDCASLAYSMVSGYLWNVKNAGEGIKNYFDFEKDGWYLEFIKGCTFDQDKYYMFAGDYFIDMIRMAWVIYVNNDILAANSKAFPGWAKTTDLFYSHVDQGYWDIDDMITLSSAVFADSTGSEVSGGADKGDERVGFAYVGNSDWVFSAASGITVYYQDKEDNYTPKVIEDIDNYIKVANKYKELINHPSVYFEQATLSSTECFLQGNFLFAISRLGEMESEALRNFEYSKSLVPVPKWDSNKQDEYLTIVHDQVEIGVILNTAKAFSAASALMQYLNEESSDVIYTYYEEGLKFRFTEDENTRNMMDLVRNTIDSPFGFQIGDHCEELYTGTGKLDRLYIETDNISSMFASNAQSYRDCMQKMIEKFKGLE